MKVVIVGGGKVGYYLAKTVMNSKTKVILIEKDNNRASQLSDELNIEVICGDGSDSMILDEAGVYDADIIAAVTGSDEENLVICQIAKVRFPRHKTIARINNPKNVVMFKALGVDKTVCSTEVIADLIEYEIATDKVRIVQTLERGKMMLAEIRVDEKCSWASREVRELNVPKELILVSVIRGDEVLYPKGDTRILAQDHVMVVSSPEVIGTLKEGL